MAKDVAVAPGNALEEASLYVQEINTAIAGEINHDKEGTQLLLIAKVMDAQSPEEANIVGKAIHARDYLDRPVEVTEISWQESDYPEGFFDAYAVFHGTDTRTSERVVITCGGNTVVPWAYRAKRDSWLPAIVVFSETKPDPETGYKAINLTYCPPL